VRRIVGMLAASLAGMMIAGGCADNSPPPARVAVPPTDQVRAADQPEIKPLPGPPDAGGQLPPPVFDDQPLVNQRLPEERGFISAYEQVGRPRILIFVNRTLEGQIVSVNPNEPVATVEHKAQSSGAITVDSQHTSGTYGYWYDSHHDENSHFQSTGPANFSESTSVYLHPGEYDEAAAKSLDYEALENVLTDWLSAGGKVAIVSPTMARQRLTDEQVKDLQSNRPRMLGEVARELDADVLIQVQAHPTRQTDQGLEIRLVAEAINVRGGESIARALVDVPPPLDKPKINKYTRFLARKLMDGMVGSWESFAGRPEGAPPAPPVAPAPPLVPGPAAPPATTAPVR
jgi:hypothetical protein